MARTPSGKALSAAERQRLYRMRKATEKKVVETLQEEDKELHNAVDTYIDTYKQAWGHLGYAWGDWCTEFDTHRPDLIEKYFKIEELVEREIILTTNLKRDAECVYNERIKGKTLPKPLKDKLDHAVTKIRTMKNWPQMTKAMQRVFDALPTDLASLEDLAKECRRKYRTQAAGRFGPRTLKIVPESDVMRHNPNRFAAIAAMNNEEFAREFDRIGALADAERKAEEQKAREEARKATKFGRILHAIVS